MRPLKFLAACLLVLALPRTAHAEWHLVPLVGFSFANDTNFFDPEIRAHKKRHTFVGGAVSYLGAGLIGVETIGIWMPGYFQGGEGSSVLESSRSAAFMGNIVLTAPRRWTEYSLRPYVSGGFGWLNVSQTPIEPDALAVDNTNIAGFNVGAGAIGFLTARTGVRFDFRYFSSIRPGDKSAIAVDEGDPAGLRYMTASIGIVFRR